MGEQAEVYASTARLVKGSGAAEETPEPVADPAAQPSELDEAAATDDGRGRSGRHASGQPTTAAITRPSELLDAVLAIGPQGPWR